MDSEVDPIETRPPASSLSRRTMLSSLAALAVAGGSRPRRALGRTNAWALDDLVKHIQSGGAPKDGIPAVDGPKYVSAAEAEKWLRPGDIVFGLRYHDTVKAYPQKVLVWHEIVNDEVRGQKISVTYCPLTGSVVAFRGRSKIDGAPLTFGTTGKLVNSNLLMYDRQTDSQWPQILGAAIAGPNKGVGLEEIALDWTTWERWRRAHPDTLVLSTDTGFFRAYGSDPYGSYDRQGTYYDSGEPFFPVMATDRRFAAKHVVVGLKVNRSRLAIPKGAVAREKAVNGRLDQVAWAALYDAERDAVRLFDPRAGDTVLAFRPDGQRFVDDRTGASWTPTGRCERGPFRGTELRRFPAYDVMWFAWYAFFPETIIWGAARR
jgi:hypothetical protein